MAASLEHLARLAKSAGEPLRLEVTTGHTLLLAVRAVGAGWCSGETLEGSRRGALIPWGSVCALWPGALAEASLEPPETIQPAASRGLDAPLRELCRLAKSLTVYSRNTSRRGRILDAGADCLWLSPPGGPPIVVPYRALVWIAVE